MAVTTAFTTSAKADYLNGLNDHTVSTGSAFKVALIDTTHNGTYGAATTNYSDITGNSDESAVTGGGSGYTAGGITLTNVTAVVDGTQGVADFADETWTITGGTDPTLGADGCLVYNSSNSNAAVSVHAFTGSPTASGEGATFTIQWPAATSGNAVIRLA